MAVWGGADGRRVNGCGQTGKVTHAGNEEGRSLGRVPNPTELFATCLLISAVCLPFSMTTPDFCIC